MVHDLGGDFILSRFDLEMLFLLLGEGQNLVEEETTEKEIIDVEEEITEYSVEEGKVDKKFM